MSEVEAIHFEEVECGKKVEGSKKRFKWKFNIKGQSYHLELAVSTLSGKRVVTLNSEEIYSEQSRLNINFQFNHVISGHTLRISRVPDNINKFEMRIDNQNFEDIMNNKNFREIKTEVSNQYKKVQYDPFADFGSVAKPANPQSNNNCFGDFDFDSFPAPAPKSKPQVGQVTQKPSPASNFKNFDFTAPVKPPSTAAYQTVKFQTNNFQTNATSNFFQNFNKFDSNIDQENFATNTFERNNYYNDLILQKPEEKSDWNDFEMKPEEKETGFFGDKFKIEMSAKQFANKVKMTKDILKMKITGQDESLI